MIHKNKIFIVFTFIIACLVNIHVYGAGQIPILYQECDLLTQDCIECPAPWTDGPIRVERNYPGACYQICPNGSIAYNPTSCITEPINTGCNPGQYLSNQTCFDCPIAYPDSPGGNAQKTECSRTCTVDSSALHALQMVFKFNDGQEIPCDCFETQSECEGTNRCEFKTGSCSACGGTDATYLDTTTHKCTECPSGYDNADKGAVGSNSCYQNCNACNTLTNDVDNDCSPGADKVHPGTSCSYTYKCNTGYYANGTSSAPNCTQCTNGPGPNYYTSTENGLTSNTCPWTITCPAGYIFSGNACTSCNAHNHSSWGTSSQITVKNYATADSPESICATDSTHSACTTSLPVCELNVYTVTLNKNASVVHNSPTGTLYQKYGTGWYMNAAATTPLTNNTFVIPSTPNLFMGYYTEQQQNPGDACTGTEVFDSNGSPVKNNLGGNTTLYACYGAPIQYNITITNGSKTFTKNGCDTVCDLDNLASTLVNNTGTYIQTIKYSYGTISWDDTRSKFTFQPNKDGINHINSSTNKLITLNNVVATCQTGYYCDASMRQQKCPFGTTSNATGAKIVTDCKYFKSEDDNKMYFRDRNSKNVCNDSNKTCFLLNVKDYAPVEISDKLKALLLNK